MRIIKILIVLLLFIFLFLGCKSQLAKNEDMNESSGIGDDLRSLDIILPNNWWLDKTNKNIYIYFDEKGKEIGFISASTYKKDFDLLTQKPNHSSVTYDDYIDISLGKCRLLTLDSDNGTAASGITGTHDVYYASIPIKGKAIYILSFTKKDKKAESKEQFIEILKNLSLK